MQESSAAIPPTSITTMTIVRPYQGTSDIVAQYGIWIKATDSLPYAWRSNLSNAQFVSRNAAKYPNSRWYAERNGKIVGYIGTHSPVTWDTGEVLMPFGFPWTFPQDNGLERELYRRMTESLPGLYPDSPAPSGLVQRFRGSWNRQLQFLEERAWKQRWTMDLMGHPVQVDGASAAHARPLNSDLQTLEHMSAQDECATDKRTVETLKRSFDGGWLEPQSTWIVKDLGAFEIEVHKDWGEVRLLITAPGAAADDTFWRVLHAKAAQMGAKEVYFTLGAKDDARRAQLQAQNYKVVETGVYPVKELTPSRT